MCFAPQRRALFRHLNFEKWCENGVFYTFWLRNVLRATTPCTFSTSQRPKVVRTPQFLPHFASKCASRHNALFQHLNFQKWSDSEVFCTFSLRNRLRAHNGVQLFISHLPRCLRTRRFSEPTFQPSGATKPRKNTVFRDFPYLFAHLHLLSSDLFSSGSSPCWLLFHLSILSEVWLLNFLRTFPFESHSLLLCAVRDVARVGPATGRKSSQKGARLCCHCIFRVAE